MKCSYVPIVVTTTYTYKLHILGHIVGCLIHRTTFLLLLKSSSFLQYKFCFVIGSVSIVIEYLQRKVPSAQPGRKNSKESFWPSINSSKLLEYSSMTYNFLTAPRDAITAVEFFAPAAFGPVKDQNTLDPHAVAKELKLRKRATM